MLKSKFAKTSADFKANRLFTDRIEPRKVFKDSILSLSDTPREITVYYGKGGIGKTKLLKTLYTGADSIYQQIPEKRIRSVYISLDAFDFANPINILLAIRNGIVGDCGLFDYAIMQYCSKARMSAEEILQKSSFLPEQIMAILNDFVSMGTLSACVPAATIKNCISFIKDLRFRKKHKKEIEEIALLNEFEIFERLPYYLGLCISFAAERGNYHVILIDSYESFLIRVKNDTPSVDREEWLKELFLSSNGIRFFIASRDRLRWAQDDSEWNDYLHQHLLNNLSDEDSRWFLEQIPVDDPALIEAFVKNSGGVPLYLDMCVSIYEDSINLDKPIDISSVSNGERIIGRYLSYLPDKEKDTVKILAALRYFDIPFALRLLQKMQVYFDKNELQRLLEKSVFVKIDEQRQLWKVDESIRLHQQSRIKCDQVAEILSAIIDCVTEKSKGAYFVHLLQAIEIAVDRNDFIEANTEKLLCAIEYYANIGFWSELHQALSSYADSDNPRLKSLAVFEELIFLRRTGNLKEALDIFDKQPLNEDMLGVWYYEYRYLGIQIKHLLGRYDESLAAYKQLISEMDMIRPTIPDHIYLAPCIKYADLLFLKGNFDESLKTVDSLISNNIISTEDMIELLRIKGHIFRFQQEYNNASFIYRSALKIAEENSLIAYIGKLNTNMAEALCTVDPLDALNWFERSKEINERISNGIELGKAYTAASVCYTKLQQFDKAIELAQRAISLSLDTGYLSGKAFALTAMYYANRSSGQIQEANNNRAELSELIDRIGVYNFILERVEND